MEEVKAYKASNGTIHISKKSAVIEEIVSIAKENGGEIYCDNAGGYVGLRTEFLVEFRSVIIGYLRQLS